MTGADNSTNQFVLEPILVDTVDNVYTTDNSISLNTNYMQVLDENIDNNSNLVYNNNDNKGVIINGEEGIYSRGSGQNIEGKNIKENWNDGEGIRSTKKSFGVNNKDIITYGTKPSISKKITYDLVKNENYNKDGMIFIKI